MVVLAFSSSSTAPASPHGYGRFWAPPAAAYSHSASVGKRPPSQAQNAKATNQLKHSIGWFRLSSAGGSGESRAWTASSIDLASVDASGSAPASSTSTRANAASGSFGARQK